MDTKLELSMKVFKHPSYILICQCRLVLEHHEKMLHISTQSLDVDHAYRVEVSLTEKKCIDLSTDKYR